MTNFIYNMQDELFNLNMILPVREFSPIKKLVDHIEAQGKQLRELNKAIEKKNKTIENYEREKESWRMANSNLFEKVQELKEGIRDSRDLTWKQKYEALLQSSEQAICALQKKCQEYKNSESDAITSTIKTLAKENKELEEKVKRLDARIRELVILCDEEYDKNEELYNENKEFKENINNKNKLLDEYMTKFNNLEHNYNEEVRMKEQFKTTCFKHEETIESQNSTIKYLKGQVVDQVRLNSALRAKLVSIGELANKIDDVILSEE